MQNVIQRSAMTALLCILLMLTGCGQKGDLYLPEGQFQNVSLG